MVAFLKRIAASPLGVIISVLAYVLMLILICALFSNGGEFIYEAF